MSEVSTDDQQRQADKKGSNIQALVLHGSPVQYKTSIPYYFSAL